MMPKELGKLLNWDKNVGHLAPFVQHTCMTTFGERDVLNAAAAAAAVCVCVCNSSSSSRKGVLLE